MELVGITISDSKVSTYLQDLYAKRKEYSNVITYDDYNFTLRKYLQNKFSQEVREVRIAPTIAYMYENFNTPEDVLAYKAKSFMYDPTQFEGAWSGTTEDGLYIVAGWENGIKGEFNPIFIGNDPPVHFFGGGDTGQGKSVVTNTILQSLVEMYPPWELELYMSDMKMMEFGMYSNYKIPHIKTIAISEDIEFTVSMMQGFRDDMLRLQDIFARLGVKNIPGFRSKYNMVIPRKLFYLEEAQQLFTTAGKRLATLEDLTSQVAKLGRATGYHMGFISQSVAGTVSKDVLNQFGAGFSVYCKGSETSEALIGNDAASLVREMGKLITNANGGDKSENVDIRVPFLDDKEDAQGNSIFKEYMHRVELRAEKLDIESTCFVYNQKSRTKFSALLNKLSSIQEEVLLLGDSTIQKKTGKSRYEKLILKRTSRENLLILSKEGEQAAKFLKQMIQSIDASPREIGMYMVSFNQPIIDMTGFESGIDVEMLESLEKFRDSEIFQMFNSVLDTYRFIEKLNVLIEKTGEEIEDLEEYYKPDVLELFDDDEALAGEFIEEALEAFERNVGEDGLYDFSKLNGSQKYLIFSGLDMSIGISRDNDFDAEATFKKFLEDGPKFGLHSIVVAQSLGEASDYFKAFNHVITYKTDFNISSKFDIDMELGKDVKGLSIYKNTETAAELKFKNPIISLRESKSKEVIDLGV